MPDWQDRLKAGIGLVPDLPLNRREADRAVAIFNRMRLTDVVGTPTMGDAAAEWIRDIVRAVFGSLDRRTGMRHLADVFVLVPKKNNKTTGGAALMLTALMMNQRPNALFGLFGPTQEISEIAFRAAAAMASHPDMGDLFHVRDHLKKITFRRTGATLKVTTFDPAVATGGLYAGWLLDEAHLLGSSHHAERVVGQLRGARQSVHESFGVIITTQSDVPPAGWFKQELQHARAIRDGSKDIAGYLPVLYEFSEADQTSRFKPWRDPANWHLVTPSLGRPVRIEMLEREYATARSKGEAAERLWASQHLNIEIGLAMHTDQWSGRQHWESATDPAVTLDHIIAECEVATVGIDGGGLDDLLAVTVIGRHRETKRWLLWGRAFVDRGVLDLRKDIAPVLLDLEASGDLAIVEIDTGRFAPESEGDSEGEGDGPSAAWRRDNRAAASPDVLGVVAVVEKLWNAGLLPEKNAVGLDPVGVSAIVDALDALDLPEGCLASVPQGYRLTGSILGMARKLKDGGLVHGGQPLMNFAVGNAKQETRGNAVLITKQTAGRAKIDPLLAAFNAFDLMSRNPEAAGGPSVYETRGLLMA
jgi:phage terminase large subunit-like protein